MKKLELTIDSRNLGELEYQMDKINTNLARYHYPLLKLETSENTEKSTKYETYIDCVVYSEFDDGSNLIGEKVNFEGVIDYMNLGKDDTKILSIDNEFISEYMKENVCTCDKCKKDIKRGKYIVFSKDVDEVKSRNDFYILGTQCAKAFFPFNVESYINRVSREFRELSQYNEFGDFEGEKCWSKTHPNPYEIAYAIDIVTNGATAKYIKGETISSVSNFYGLLRNPSRNEDEEFEFNKILEKNTNKVGCETLINNAKEFYNNLKYLSDFDFNCKTILNNIDSLDFKYFGRFVSAVIFGNIGFKKFEAKKAEHKESVAHSNFVGEVGEKFDNWELTFKKLFCFENEWGFTNIYKFMDNNNNTIVWSTQKSLHNKDNKSLVDGDKINLKGTIKEHKVYRDEKQTCITRCKVL